jgi:hypothetical protein
MTMTIRFQRACWIWTGLLHCFIALGCGLVSLQAAGQFRLFTRPLDIPERGTVISYVLHTADAEFRFLPPVDWVVQENATTRTVVMMARNLTTSISFKIVETGSEARADTNQWRNAISEKYPDAKILAEFPCYTGSGGGTAFDLERKAANKSRLLTRLAFVPIPGGTVEFNLTAPAGKLDELHLAFGNLLTSFRVEPARAK